jgi:hypothetical protein
MQKMKSKRILWAWLGLPLLLGLSPAPEANGGMAQNNANGCSIYNRAFQHGEELTYKVYYNLNFVWVAAGEAVFRVNEVDEQFHYSVKGATYSSYDWFYKVRDYYDTYAQKKSLLPTRSIRNIQEGGYTLYDKVDFDQRRNTAFSTRGRSKEKIKEEKEYPVDPCMHDILSIIYYTRNLDFDQMEADDKIPVKIFLDKEIYALNMKFNGRVAGKSIKGLGKFNTIEFSPEVLAGQYFKEGSTMRIWATDDENRIPLLIESPIAVGSIKAVLVSYKGLRNEFKAKVEN